MENNFSCILIDDDIDEHEFFQIILRKCSLPVDCVYTRSCIEAITAAEKTPEEVFSFIIVDWILLDKISLGCSRELKDVSVFGKSKFIIYSVTPPPKNILSDYALNERFFIKKDHSFEAVAEELRSLVTTL
ncbi:hypothetical protein ACFP1I_12015 [Dyadobacter subterraneus]|uniref:Response regulatory domain-containing protein n=1 Tax=Dyadobacter subterraneus TaxID=2773304 RepID=A0ABR9WFE7_9BACT|nr:hypothetical protein [Dyadobacter subterraneus]MBE9463651.1 hypothetical protein [Dyadobacter subterraneus]